MKKLIAITFALFFSLSLHAQIFQSDAQPVKTGSIGTSMWIPVVNEICLPTSGVLCVIPSTSGQWATGVVDANRTPFTQNNVYNNGILPCAFNSTLPIQGHLAVIGNGECLDDPRPMSQIPYGTGVLGVITQLLGPNLAWVRAYGSEAHGGYMAATDVHGLAPVAITGAYSSLTGTPIIPAAQVQSDWNAISGPAAIQNKPTIPAASVSYMTPAGVAITGIKRIVSGPIATAANGAWSLNFAGAGCTLIRSVNVSVVSPVGTIATQQYTAYYNTLTATSISGTVYSGQVLLILGATIVPISSSTNVFVSIDCT